MPAFKFKLSQCVMVPGADFVQGRVSGRSEFISGPNLYQLAWLDAAITLQNKVFSEDELLGQGASAPDLPAVDFAPAPSPSQKSKRKAKR